MDILPEMPAKARNCPNRPQTTDDDAEAAGELLRAIVKGYGRGGLTWLAGKLGKNVSAMRKRLRSNCAGMDPFTMRAVLLIEQTRGQSVNGSVPVNGYAIGRDARGEPTWEPAE